jgi:hypothetical protein
VGCRRWCPRDLDPGARAVGGRPGRLDLIGSDGCVTLVPDLRREGTNVAAVPAAAGFGFSYGPGSFERHRAEAARLGLSCVVIDDVRLAADVDLPEDLELLPATAAPLS